MKQAGGTSKVCPKVPRVTAITYVCNTQGQGNKGVVPPCEASAEGQHKASATPRCNHAHTRIKTHTCKYTMTHNVAFRGLLELDEAIVQFGRIIKRQPDLTATTSRRSNNQRLHQDSNHVIHTHTHTHTHTHAHRHTDAQTQ